MIRLFAAALLSLGLAWPASAQDKHHHHGAHAAGASAQGDGEVRKVDKTARKVTIKHGPLTGLDMPAMTMVFQVKDPALLERVKAGDKVKFTVAKTDDALVVTKIDAVK